MPVRIEAYTKLLTALGANEGEVASYIHDAQTYARDYSENNRPIPISRIGVSDVFMRALSTVPEEKLVKVAPLIASQHVLERRSSRSRLKSFPLWATSVNQQYPDCVVMIDLGRNVVKNVSFYADFIQEACSPSVVDRAQDHTSEYSPLPAVSVLPFDRMNQNLRRRASRLTRESPVLEATSVTPLRIGEKQATVCPDAWGRYRKVLVEGEAPSDYGKAALICLDERPVAIMKLLEQQSVLGLETIRDAQGRHPLVRGGLYAPSPELKREVDVQVEERKRSGDSTKFLVVDVESMRLRPLEMFDPRQGVLEHKEAILSTWLTAARQTHT